MLLGSDIDGVVIDFVSVIQRQFQELYNIVLPYDKISTYRIEDCVPLSSEQVESVIDDILLKFTLIRLFSSQVENKNTLMRHGYVWLNILAGIFRFSLKVFLIKPIL